MKSAIPTHALAKFNFRLVPNQDPEEVDFLLRNYIQQITPPAILTRIRTLASSRPVLTGRKHPAARAAVCAYRYGFGVEPVFLRNGGSIPVVSRIQEILHIPVVLMGFGLPDDHIHGPDERFHLPVFFNGIETGIRFLSEIARCHHAGIRQSGKQNNTVARRL